MRDIKPVELTFENFKAYGIVLSSVNNEPMADNEEFKYWSKVSLLKMHEVVSSGMLFGLKREPLIKKLERHVNTPEVLVALQGDSVICVTEPSPKGSTAIDGIQAFYIKQGDAIAMNPGVWHWIPIPVN